MSIEKPGSVACDAFKSAKWDELTAGRSLPRPAAPTLQLLVQWHTVVMQCIQDLDDAVADNVTNEILDYLDDLGRVAAALPRADVV